MAKKSKPIDPKRLRAAREKRDLTQAQAAELFSVATITYASWELGYRKPSGPADALIKMKFPELAK